MMIHPFTPNPIYLVPTGVFFCHIKDTFVE